MPHQNESEQPNATKVLKLVTDVLQSEARCILDMVDHVDGISSQIVGVVDLLNRCEGRVIVTGMGKMSAIARKTAATLSSVGTPAVFLHPTEALHGDLGIVTSEDLLLALSHSGETLDLLRLIPFMKRNSVPVVTVSGNSSSSLALASDICVPTGVVAEADTVTGAPSNSTTTTLAFCDAVALTLVRLKGFTAEQFAVNHPAGQLGRKLLLKVEDVMVTDGNIPFVQQTSSLREAIVVISKGKLGAGLVVDSEQCLLGILTDGDLRRVLEKHPNPLDLPAKNLMTTQPLCTEPHVLAAEVLHQMNQKTVNVMPVVRQNKVVGILHVHELLRAGLG